LPTASDFRKALKKLLNEEKKKGALYVDVRAANLHRSVGDYPGKNNRMSLCCEVMRSMMRQGDEVLKEPKKGYGASLTIRYHLRSKKAKGKEKTETPPPEEENQKDEQKTAPSPSVIHKIREMVDEMLLEARKRGKEHLTLTFDAIKEQLEDEEITDEEIEGGMRAAMRPDDTIESEKPLKITYGLKERGEKKWFVLKVESGREEAIRDALRARVSANRLTYLIPRVLVPVEKVSEIRGRKKRVVDRKLYPGYVIIEVETDEDGRITEPAWFLIRETPGVQGFLGVPFDRRTKRPPKPLPMKRHEVERVLALMEEKRDMPKIRVDFKVGDTVRIKEGPFENFDGYVDEINAQKGIVKVVVNIFGRATPIELEYWQVEPL